MNKNSNSARTFAIYLFTAIILPILFPLNFKFHILKFAEIIGLFLWDAQLVDIDLSQHEECKRIFVLVIDSARD